MPRVYIPTLLRHLSQGEAEVEVEGTTVGKIFENLETLHPGFAALLLDNDRLRPNLAIAIDDDITPASLSHPVSTGSEVYIITAIRGG